MLSVWAKEYREKLYHSFTGLQPLLLRWCRPRPGSWARSWCCPWCNTRCSAWRNTRCGAWSNTRCSTWRWSRRRTFDGSAEDCAEGADCGSVVRVGEQNIVEILICTAFFTSPGLSARSEEHTSELQSH